MIPFPSSDETAPVLPEEGVPEYGDDLDSEFQAGILEAFPELSEGQIAALKAAIEACVEARESGGKSTSKPKGKDSGLALIFGKGK